MIDVAIIGSHGYKGSYGGWDQLVNNLISKKKNIHKIYLINPKENKTISDTSNLIILQSSLSGFGIQGLLLDFYGFVKFAKKAKTFLLLGAKSVPIAIFFKFILNKKIVVNVGGVEWERPEYNYFLKVYLKICFNLAILCCDRVIFDNEHYFSYVKNKKNKQLIVIPYGGYIDSSLNKINYIKRYSFLKNDYFLSVSRSISDNKVDELCHFFKQNQKDHLVMISNLSKTEYGKKVLAKYGEVENITLIDGLYNKKELDLLRNNCKAYIHTHTLCGSAPSLIEMIVACKPIISIDVPQNRFTLKGECSYFKNFQDLGQIISKGEFLMPPRKLAASYKWDDIVAKYESALF